MVVDYLDHFLRARHVCGDWSIVSAFAAKEICVSSSMETFQAPAGAVVVLLNCRVRTFPSLSSPYVRSVDILFPLWPANFSDSQSMVHISHVVLEGICMASRTRAIYLCVNTQVQITYSVNRNVCCGCAGSIEH